MRKIWGRDHYGSVWGWVRRQQKDWGDGGAEKSADKRKQPRETLGTCKRRYSCDTDVQLLKKFI